MLKWTWVLMVMVLSSQFAHAGITLNNGLKFVGEARLKYMFWNVYDAQLFTTSGQYVPGEYPIQLTLTYLRDFTAKDLVKATNEQWQHLGKFDLKNTYDKQLLSLWPNIKKGDSLTLLTNAKGQATFLHNTKELGVINGRDFAENFLAIWLDKDTSHPEFRRELIGDKP
ncbi:MULTISPECIES: chalcone isomerase family protein [Vibrio]|uniref:chalcone isomerase family protein n=1 Tax=Vibrio TaxID=662 RepID=UPI00097F33A0|nr:MULTISPECIES: chalcone isomerase family protein [Vibrio]SJN23994.1 Hypothetical periplasmic protein [Vibrio casei]